MEAALPAPAPAAAPHPWVWAVLYFPYGLTFGFPAIGLGYLGARAGLSVSTIAGVVGVSWLAAGWKFVWAPIGDYTLTRRRWYLLSLASIAAGMAAMTLVPLTPRTVPLVSGIVLVTSVAGTFLAFATEGLMVHNVPEAQRGRAGGWFQSGNQFGQTAGGGIGLWLVQHAPAPWMAAVAFAAIAGGCALALRHLREPPRAMPGASAGARARDAWAQLASVVRSRIGRLALLLAILPIGSGAAQYLFGSISAEWHAPADTVSLVLGLGGGLAIVAGCFVGGRLADRMPRTRAYALSCALGLAACVVMALSPRTAVAYTCTTLLYTFSLGMVVASFTGLVLSLVGHGAAATKINLFFALNTLFSVGTLRLDGWAHDARGSSAMLYAEALVGLAALGVFAAVAGRMRGAAGSDERSAMSVER